MEFLTDNGLNINVYVDPDGNTVWLQTDNITVTGPVIIPLTPDDAAKLSGALQKANIEAFAKRSSKPKVP